MKHYCILLAVMVTVAIGTASAQKGLQGIGVNIGLLTNLVDELENVSLHDHVAPIIDVKYQYGISKIYRIEPYVSVKKLEGEVGFGAGINNHFFFRGIKRFRPYGLVGIGYNSMKFTDIQWVVQPIPVESHGLYVRGGLGIDYRFTHQWSMQAELSCDWHIGGEYVFVFIPFKVGVAYNF